MLIHTHAGKVDAIYFSLHGAMGAEGETDPEGYLLERVRAAFGPDVPIVISLDLHGILTDRMIRQVDGLAIYQTYPHVDFADTGVRAARQLLDIVDRGLKPVIARVTVPLLARGDECITKTGWYGDVLREGQLFERSGKALAAGVMIGNPFTDAPELCTQALVVAESDAVVAQEAATGLAEAMWRGRHRLVGKLIAPEKAVALARYISGPVLFTDAAHNAGVGATISIGLGGSVDKSRFQPLAVTATVESLSRGRARLETMGLPLEAGPTAVLSFDKFTVVVLSRPVFLFDRALYYANGLDPQDFDLIVVKSPHTEFHMYDQWVEKNFNVDAPGSTSANVAGLGHALCARPSYPIEPDTEFVARLAIYRRRP